MDVCNVCGGTDMNLVDGYYYCVECGTQDVNVRETVVEQTVVGDGTFAHTTSRKIITAVKDGIEMSSEWHKWHIFNFILVGLTDELIALGAKPSLKMKVLWVWTRYVKQYQVKEDLQPHNTLGIEIDDEELSKGDDNNDKEPLNEDDNNENDSSNEDSDVEKRNPISKAERLAQQMKNITKATLLTILYVALNLDRSDIQLSHLFRFIREGRLSLYDCMKFVPKELKLTVVNNWKSFTLSVIEHNPITIRKLSMTCFKVLNLGVPLVPDLRKIVKTFLQELCLPKEVKDLVFGLMHFVPIDFLYVDTKSQRTLYHIPDYEGVVMAYILVALKICFGLDDEYEVKISEEIDKINNEENYLKSYKLGLFSEPCDRLFSFRDWCQHLQFRKRILCKNYLPMARQFNYQIDDYVFMEHFEKRKKREVKLSDDITMDILNKIKSNEEPQVIPKVDFPVTLTPMSTYIDVIAQSTEDPDLRLLLCEDFTQYSLGYAIRDFKLPGCFPGSNNPLVGVCESGKRFNENVTIGLGAREGDKTMVYVRNCQNKNWLKTQPPKMNHITKIGIGESSSDKESDHGYDSNTENSNPESDANITGANESVLNNDKTLEIIDDPDNSKCIFDDNFIDLFGQPTNNGHISIKEEREDNYFEIDTESKLSMHNHIDSIQNIENGLDRVPSQQFDSNIFDRDKIIKELIELACKKYKIPIPKERAPKIQYKRKANLANDEASSSEPKKKRSTNRAKPGETKRLVDNFISIYYSTLQNNIMKEVSEQVKSMIEDADNINNVVLDTKSEPNESRDVNYQNDTDIADFSNLREENDESQLECDTIDNTTTNRQAERNSVDQDPDNVTIDETLEEEILQEIFPKTDPQFDEKDHDIRQLYVKLREDSDVTNISISDIAEEPGVDKIIREQIEKFSVLDKTTKQANDIDTDEEHDSFSDSDDDVPLSVLKETSCFEREKEERRKEKLEPIVRDPSKVKKFKYWLRHYKGGNIAKFRDMGKKFDMELNQNFPISFVFVIRECIGIVGGSMFSLYKNMQNIEDILISYM